MPYKTKKAAIPAAPTRPLAARVAIGIAPAFDELELELPLEPELPLEGLELPLVVVELPEPSELEELLAVAELASDDRLDTIEDALLAADEIAEEAEARAPDVELPDEPVAPAVELLAAAKIVVEPVVVAKVEPPLVIVATRAEVVRAVL